MDGRRTRVACGAGYYVLALIATTLTVLILAALTRMEGWLADDGKVVSASEQQKQQLPQR